MSPPGPPEVVPTGGGIVIETFDVENYTNGGETLTLSKASGISSTDDVEVLIKKRDPSDSGDFNNNQEIVAEVDSVSDNGVTFTAKVIDHSASPPTWSEVANNNDIQEVMVIAQVV